MKERPIIFSAPMVRAILAGTKTQTRRVVKPQPADVALLPRRWSDAMRRRDSPDMYGNDGLTLEAVPMADGSWGQCRCPYGQPGDRLWVREAWSRDEEDGALFYRADVGTGNEADDWQRNIDDGASGYRWKPSIHMPRWASRILLDVTAVRVERLQDISDEDSLAEGIYPTSTGLYPGSPRAAYQKLWEQINGPGAWDANPWVWVVEFRRVEA